MARKTVELSALEVKRLIDAGFYFVGGVAGLALVVQPKGGRSWILRVVVGSKRRDIGLGSYPAVTLAKAKEQAAALREKIKAGIDPVEERKQAASALKAAQASSLTFEQAALAFIDSHKAGWRNEKHIQQWANTLSTYAYPHIGNMLVRNIELPHILSVLEPIRPRPRRPAACVAGLSRCSIGQPFAASATA